MYRMLRLHLEAPASTVLDRLLLGVLRLRGRLEFEAYLKAHCTALLFNHAFAPWALAEALGRDLCTRELRTTIGDSQTGRHQDRWGFEAFLRARCTAFLFNHAFAPWALAEALGRDFLTRERRTFIGVRTNERDRFLLGVLRLRDRLL